MVEYRPIDQARALAEVDELPEGVQVLQILSEYAVLRAHVRATDCGTGALLPAPRVGKFNIRI